KDQHRLWQVWIDSPTDNPILELEVKYPRDVRQRSDGRGYMFRLALEWAANEADRVNSTCVSQLMERMGLLKASLFLASLAGDARHRRARAA
ncbi:hypothetical protein, partial [Pseudomonas putida]|uniref:hypothetical protein n=1 Tax=Pseudomonas putida TaxID=303 RepID=UPI00236681A8